MSNQDQFSGTSENLFIENLPQKKYQNIEIECEDIDRISKLPYALIVQILSLLSITDTFRTSTLSKDRQYFWTFINNVVYDTEEYGRLDSSAVHKFISFTDNVLPILSHLNWLEVYVNKKVKHICLNIRYIIVYPSGNDQSYSFLEVLRSSSSMKKLKCNNCII
ncbi:hypothetical protein H5410_060724 [Solanum commersonii]|uniref:F-box domain-containing protein n=1 Tax=Solanum commersonii TaxID=4109 RepID=A0A9J5W7F8_SOLCO|nr:hypothetical protein H5410_060724 [Solanum commersonii]